MRLHPSGKKIIWCSVVLFAAVNVSGWALCSVRVAGLCTAATAVLLTLVIRFFRYPARTVAVSADRILAPADGTVCFIGQCSEPEYLNTTATKVSIFMSPLNVHVNWTPVVGTVSFLKHTDGKFYAAFKDKSAEENERFCTAIRLADGREIVVKQVAGAVARRILNFLTCNQNVTQNTELGFIRFGSRVDLYLPADVAISVNIGDKVTGSQTVIGTL
jgi:phosphatidylserine decarboxylase